MAFLALLVVGPDAGLAKQPRVLATGDSMVEPVAAKLKRSLRVRDEGKVVLDPQPASGISKPWRRDWLTYAPFQIERDRPRATVMMIGANDGYPLLDDRGREVACCRRAWVDAYSRTVIEMMASYTAGGRYVYWLNLPAPRDETRFKIFAAVNAALDRAARRQDRVRLLDMVEKFTPGYRYRRSMTVDGRRVTVRERDGIHLNARGGQIAARIIRKHLIEDKVVAPAAASASATKVTLEYEPPIPHVEPDPAYTLAVEASAGEENRLEVLRDDEGFLVRELGGVTVVAGERCQALPGEEVRCKVTGNASHLSVFVDAGDLGDTVAVGPLPGVELAEVLGGPGDDVIAGGDGADLLLGEAGRDWLGGLGGADRIDGGPGDDLLDGGAGRDLVTYASRRAGVTVDLALGSGGTEGEADQLKGFEDAAGGRGSDRLFGDDGVNLLYGGLDGKDSGEGRAGNDTVSARRAVGGPGDDHLDGKLVACGSGEDVVTRFRFLPNTGYGPRCEQIVGHYYVMTRPRRVRGGMRFALSCPIRSCGGTFSLSDSRGRFASRRYKVRGEGFGGKGPRAVTLPFERPPAGNSARLSIVGKSLSRDSFRISVR